VRPDFKSTYDACCIMVIQDENTWAKAALRNLILIQTPCECCYKCCFGWCKRMQYRSRFSLASNGTSWKQLRNPLLVGWKKYDMVRLFTMHVENTVKVGLEAQCPTGEGGYRYFCNLSIEQRTVSNLRAGY